MLKSKDGRYEIRISRMTDHYMKHETDWLVVELKTDKVVAVFSESCHYRIRSVSFTDDDKHIKIEHYAKRDEIFPIETPDQPIP